MARPRCTLQKIPIAPAALSHSWDVWTVGPFGQQATVGPFGQFAVWTAKHLKEVLYTEKFTGLNLTPRNYPKAYDKN